MVSARAWGRAAADLADDLTAPKTRRVLSVTVVARSGAFGVTLTASKLFAVVSDVAAVDVA